jgi:uncharacterized protein
MSSIDEQFVEFIVKSLVGNPDAVVIDRRVDEKGVLLELTVDPEDLGRIIGKRGATAQSLRTLLRALGTKNDARYNLKIIDNGPEDYERPERPQSQENQHNDSYQSSNQQQGETTVTDDDEENMESVVVNNDTTDKIGGQEESSDMVRKTRAELEDLDDLDI